jgi:hypothetical protein
MSNSRNSSNSRGGPSPQHRQNKVRVVPFPALNARRSNLVAEAPDRVQTNGDHVEAHQEQHTPEHVVIPVPSTRVSRERSDTMLSAVSSITGPHGEKRMSSMFFVVQTLESIQNTKEGKRKGPLKDAIAKALGICDIFKPPTKLIL